MVIESSDEEINWTLLKLPKTNSTSGQTYNANFTCPDLPLPASREAAAPAVHVRARVKCAEPEPDESVRRNTNNDEIKDSNLDLDDFSS